MKKIILIFATMFVMTIQAFAGLTAPYFGINGYFQGTSYFSSDNKSDLKGKPQFMSGLGVDLKLGKEVFFIGTFHLTTYDIFNNFKFQPFDGVFSVGAGVGWYLFDSRAYGRGHSLTMSIIAIRNVYTSSLDYKNFYIAEQYGAQVRVSYYYNIFRNFAIMLSPYFDINFGKLTYKNDYLEYDNTTGFGLDYGLIIGVAF